MPQPPTFAPSRPPRPARLPPLPPAPQPLQNAAVVFTALFLLPAAGLVAKRDWLELASHLIFNAGLLAPYLLRAAVGPAAFVAARDASVLLDEAGKLLLAGLIWGGALPYPKAWQGFTKGNMDVLMLVLIKPLAEQVAAGGRTRKGGWMQGLARCTRAPACVRACMRVHVRRAGKGSAGHCAGRCRTGPRPPMCPHRLPASRRRPPPSPRHHHQTCVRTAAAQHLIAALLDAHIYAHVSYGGAAAPALARAVAQNLLALSLLVVLDMRARMSFLRSTTTALTQAAAAAPGRSAEAGSATGAGGAAPDGGRP